MLNAVTRRKVFSRYLTEVEEKQLLREVGRYADPLAQRDHAWMILMRQTGIRVGSLAQLTVADARAMLASGTVTIADEIAKGGRGYQVPLNKAARAAAQKLLRIRKDQGFEPIASMPLLMSRKGFGLSVRSMQARMQQWVKEAKLPVAASPHWLRHTLAKAIVRNSCARDPQSIVQIALGHRYRETTVLYTLPDREEVLQALENAS
jgi:site-specific recombinase XerC